MGEGDPPTGRGDTTPTSGGAAQPRGAAERSAKRACEQRVLSIRTGIDRNPLFTVSKQKMTTKKGPNVFALKSIYLDEK